MSYNMNKIEKLHRKYAKNEILFNLVYEHCQVVTEIAIWCAENIDEPVDLDLLKTSCLLHDIGSYGFLNDSFDRKYYVQHAILGSKILEAEGYSEELCSIVETHVVLGLTKDEIEENGMKLPLKDYTPKTIEARILCYADRFHTKDAGTLKPVFNSFEYYRKKLKSGLPKQEQKFIDWSEEFGIPDIENLAKKYDHHIR